MLTTPAGKAFCAHSASMTVASGVYGLGLMTQVLPVIVDGRIFPLTATVNRHTDQADLDQEKELCCTGWLTADWEIPRRNSTDDTAWCVHDLVQCIVVLGDHLVFQFTLLQEASSYA